MRRWEELNKQYANKGLRFISAYSGFHTLETIQKKVKDLGLTLPVALDGFYQSRFIARILCFIWVIGPDGKVAYIGQDGWEEAALKELKKVKYPGLGLDQVADPLQSAAKAFGEGKLAEADKLAEAVASGDFEEQVVNQAEQIRARVTERRKLLEVRADTEEVCGDYGAALACWREIAARFGEQEYERSPREELARITKLSDFEAEQKARLTYVEIRQKCWACFENTGNDNKKVVAACEKAIALMEDFVKANKDRRSVAHAELLLEYWRELKEELQPTPEKK